MYSERELASAVEAGAVSEESAAGLRAHTEGATGQSLADNEPIRWYRGLDETLMVYSGLVLALGLGFFFGTMGLVIGGLITIAALWGLSELFVSKRGSTYSAVWFGVFILFAGLFAFFTMFTGEAFVKNPQMAMIMGEMEPKTAINAVGGAAFITALILGGYGYRFKQPFAGYLSVYTLFLALLAFYFAMNLQDITSIMTGIYYVMLIIGIIVFAVALYLDFGDRERVTLRSETATWLHLLAGALISQGFFTLLGVNFQSLTMNYGSGSGFAALMLLFYIIFAAIALILNRRGLIISGLMYPIIALAVLMFGGEPPQDPNSIVKIVAGSAILVGGGLVALAWFWPKARKALVSRLPAGIQRRVPAYPGQVLDADEFE